MKVSVRIRGEWFAVPCGAGDKTIRWLGDQALQRFTKIKPRESSATAYEMRRTRGGAIIDWEDCIADVIDDDDFVTLVLESDVEDPAFADRPHIHYIPELVPNDYVAPTDVLVVDGESLTIEDVVRLGKGDFKIQLSSSAKDRVKKSRAFLEDIVAENRVVYGVTTGFGKFATTVIDRQSLRELQTNLIRSHAAGVGNPLPPERTRMLLALRINILAKGYSGISLENLERCVACFNASCLSWVPEKGTVGASGDLAPLSHLALGMMGEGKMWCPETGWGEAKYILESKGLEPLDLHAKEGIALINGTQFITAFGAECVERGKNLARQADIIAALSLEVLKGTTTAFSRNIHDARPHPGQGETARRLRSLLHSETYPSEISISHRFCNKVQDAYTIRCVPQVHGITHDTIKFVQNVISTEINSATDNPLVFADTQEIVSAGNFHGEYPAKSVDYLAIAIHELGSMSERRTERLVNPAYSELPAFLTHRGGLESGFMLAHCTAAALVSENKVLCHPASVDSLTTSAGQEDHVSMGGFAARKCLQVVENVERVLAIELLSACQAMEFLRPLKSTRPIEAIHSLVRSAASEWDKDRFMAPDIDAVTELLTKNLIWKTAKPFMDNYHIKQMVETPVRSPTSTLRRKGKGGGGAVGGGAKDNAEDED